VWCVCVDVCVCGCVCGCVCVWMCVCGCVCVWMCVCVDVCVCVYGCLCLWMSLFVDVFYRISQRSENECPSCKTTNCIRKKSNIYLNSYRRTIAICLPTGIPDTYKSLCHVLQHKHVLNIYWVPVLQIYHKLPVQRYLG